MCIQECVGIIMVWMCVVCNVCVGTLHMLRSNP